MKKVLMLSIFSIFLSNCTTEEISTPTTNTTEVVPTQEVAATETISSENTNSISERLMKTSTEILITNVTRGFSSSVSIKNAMLTKNSTGVIPPTTVQINKAKWNVLKQKFNALNLVKIPTYNAPSCASCSDAGYSQTLVIKHDGVEYTSQSYDSSNPPLALKDFLNYIKTLN
jgi:hypothetical protein